MVIAGDSRAGSAQGATPSPSSAAAFVRMKTQKRRDTKPELLIRSALHRQGLRFRVDQAPIPGMRSRADIVFTKKRLAVFVNGCFWHSCPQHGTWPKSNADWWRKKLLANKQRDLLVDSKLKEAGWRALRIWEHEDPAGAAEKIRNALTSSELLPEENVAPES